MANEYIDIRCPKDKVGVAVELLQKALQMENQSFHYYTHISIFSRCKDHWLIGHEKNLDYFVEYLGTIDIKDIERAKNEN